LERAVKILCVSQYFPPEMGAPAARIHELSRRWVARGHDVTVLTGFPNHPTGVVPPEYRGQLLRREIVDGIRVVRAPIYVAPNRGVFRRIANYASFSVSASLLGPILTDRPDVVVATSPQLLTGVAGWWNAVVRRAPFVFDVRDLWPQSVVEVGAMRAGSPGVRLLEQIEHQLYRRADRIVVVTDSFVDAVAAHGIARERIDVVTNGVDLELFRPLDRAQARQALGLAPDAFLVSYVGTHGMAHGLETALDAAALQKDTPLHLLLVGEGAEKQRLRDYAARQQIGNVTFWDHQPRDRVALVLAASDVCLVMLRNRPLFHGVIPSKIFEILGSGRAIVTTVDGESRAIVERAGAGRFCPPEDAAALAATLAQVMSAPAQLDQMGRSGRAFVERHYSRESLADRYLDILARCSDARR
jgi:glycosyltransferase involved in cell wall biosynthesis